MAENVAFVREQVRLARDAGADFVMTPENTGLIGASRTETLQKAQTEDEHAMLAACRASARETGAWFLLGSIHVRVPGEEQIRNRSYLIDSDGGIVASYDKIHMFDVQLAGGESYRESSTFRPGERSVLAETPWGVLGMTICYDLRFPYLYRDLAHAGATMLSIPSSFTVPTGQAHWHTLMRVARDRDRLLRLRARAGRHAQGLQPQDLRPFDRGGAVGRGAGRCRRREGGLRHRRRRPRQDRRGAQDGAVAAARPAIRSSRAGQAGSRQGGGIDRQDRRRAAIRCTIAIGSLIRRAS